MNLDDTHFLQAIGSAIRDLRDARGMTQAQLAEACGLHRTFIGSVERGERNVSLENIARIARGLGVSLSVLFDFPVPVSPATETPNESTDGRHPDKRSG